MPSAEHAANKACREARREIIVRIVRLQPGVTLKDLVEQLRKLHAQGDWPKAPWRGARQDPYDTGIRQTMYAMRRGRWKPDGELVGVQEDGWTVRWYHVDDVAGEAEKLLPVDEEAAELKRVADRYRRAYGRELLYGVTDDLRRVVRMDTGRGVVEEEVTARYGWTGALLRLGVINDEDLVPT